MPDREAHFCRRGGRREGGDAYDGLYALKMRQAVGPMCERCAVHADEWYSEYCTDHDASSELLRAAENQWWMCLAGQHPQHWPRVPGMVREGWDGWRRV